MNDKSAVSRNTPWLQSDPEGLTRGDLLSLREAMRGQRNVHRSSIYEYLRFYVTLLSALFAAEAAIGVLGIRILSDPGILLMELITISLLLLILPLGVAIGIFRMHKAAQQLIQKEYEKLMEHLTVEQKLEFALGFTGPLGVATDFPKEALYPKDSSVLHPRWIAGRREYGSAQEFVDTMVTRPNVFFAPLVKIIKFLFYMNIALALIIALFMFVKLISAF